MKCLLTGFEPFATCTVNPSEQIVRTLAADPALEPDLVTAILPVDSVEAPRQLVELIDTHRPDAVVCLGVAMNRSAIEVERQFFNELSFGIPDNAGRTITGESIVADGPAVLSSSLPIDAMLDAITSCGVSAKASDSAGRYLCNQVAYLALHTVRTRPQECRAGFIHVPPLDVVPLADQVNAIRAALQALS